jgi:hypothetical protein
MRKYTGFKEKIVLCVYVIYTVKERKRNPKIFIKKAFSFMSLLVGLGFYFPSKIYNSKDAFSCLITTNLLSKALGFTLHVCVKDCGHGLNNYKDTKP